MSSRSLAELRQWIEQAATLRRALGLSSFVKVTFEHGVRGDPATYPL
jgi:hypothetical protein